MGAQIAVLGSINMDLVAVTEVAPAPGQTVTGQRFFTSPGGKGANQAVAASLAGAQVTMLGAVGRDAFGEELLRALAGKNVDVAEVSLAEVGTGTAHIVVDAAGSNSIVVVPAANGTVTRLSTRHREIIARSDVLLMQLELPVEVVAEAAAFARASGVTVILTPAPVRQLPDGLLADVDLLIANEGESLELTGARNAQDAAGILARTSGAVIITLGEQGCLYVGAEGRLESAARRVAAVDTTAAGDTFVGALAVALAEGTPVADALDWAGAAAALAVQRFGASSSMPTRSEIAAFAGAGR
ncbi:MAG TPA: ribokinase [Arthrobacter sp.]|nr:ribokinase [Arthrobacter sp.]